MFEKIDKRFEYLLDILSKNRVDVEIVKKAYAKAKELHFYQKRKDGTPYLSHPVEVAIILAELQFDEDAICAALLHDTIEDCGYTFEQMEKEFNHNIAVAVDCVSKIDKAEYIYDKDEIYEDPNFIKASAEEQTFKKLISMGKKNPLGFYVKFADRLHNLSTIDDFEYAKQLEKVRETEKWILPIAKALKAQYFDIKIKNECFKIVNKKNGQEFFEQYNNYHNSNKKNISNLLSVFQNAFDNKYFSNILIDDLSERKVFESLKEKKKVKNIENILQGQLQQVPNYAVYFVIKNNTDKAIVTKQVFSKFNNKLNFLKIVGVEIGGFSNLEYYIFRDELYNYYKLYVLTATEYQNLIIGITDDKINYFLDEDNINSLDMSTIKVKTSSGEIMIVQKGSTVLDFAFKIHKEIGFAFRYAIINDSKTKFPPYTKLNENDKVEIIIDKDENNNIINNAKLRWLAYVNTEYAKKILIKYFENKFIA